MDSGRPSVMEFEVGKLIQVDRPDSAPWYGVIKWIGTLPGSTSLFAGLEMVCHEKFHSHSQYYDEETYMYLSLYMYLVRL
jgi:hypothetical protein